MHDSMKSLSIANFPEKLELQDTQISKSSIWFDENGVSLRGWVNPATGNTTAIKKIIRIKDVKNGWTIKQIEYI